MWLAVFTEYCMEDGSTGGSSSFGRALFTDREREILSGEATVKDNYRYKVESVARQRAGKLEEDIDALRENYPEIVEQIQEAVCDEP